MTMTGQGLDGPVPPADAEPIALANGDVAAGTFALTALPAPATPVESAPLDASVRAPASPSASSLPPPALPAAAFGSGLDLPEPGNLLPPAGSKLPPVADAPELPAPLGSTGHQTPTAGKVRHRSAVSNVAQPIVPVSAPKASDISPGAVRPQPAAPAIDGPASVPSVVTGGTPLPAAPPAPPAALFASVSAQTYQGGEAGGLEAALDRLVQAREQAQPGRATLSVSHAELGRIAVRIEAPDMASTGTMRAVLAAADSDLASSVQTALAERISPDRLAVERPWIERAAADRAPVERAGAADRAGADLPSAGSNAQHSHHGLAGEDRRGRTAAGSFNAEQPRSGRQGETGLPFDTGRDAGPARAQRGLFA